MRNALFLAWHDLRHQLKQGETLLWLFIMPPIFFYFIGTVTGGFASSVSGSEATPVAVIAEQPGYLRAQLDRRLRENEFAPDWYENVDSANLDGSAPSRMLLIEPAMTEAIVRGEPVGIRYDTRASALTRDFEAIRIQRSLYTALADIVVAGAMGPPGLSQRSLDALNGTPRVWTLEVTSAGKRISIPSGFEQAIPGILVMFTLLVLLTSGASLLAIERSQGLLRRLAYAPVTRAEIVAGKWIGRMGLASVQIVAALIVGTWLFAMHWGPDFAMVLLVLVAWAAFCASAGLLLGCLARTPGQAAGLGALLANLLAALGGCWWPIEITPAWMQTLQKLLPTGWAMDALHQLVSFEAGPVAVIPHIIALLVGAMLVSLLAVRRFRYE